MLKLSHLTDPIDIFLSHDWPTLVGEVTNIQLLGKIKPHFKKDLNGEGLGSPVLSTLLKMLKPRFWFSAHLHLRWEQDIKHQDGTTTTFLALDKPIPKRGFLDISTITS